jgi:small subunit ribosomal protein S16
MLMIRLARFGSKKRPTYRVVVIEKERARDGRAVEVVGHYNPVMQPHVVSLKMDRVQHWLRSGAQPSDTVARLLRNYPADQAAVTPAVEAPAA